MRHLCTTRSACTLMTICLLFGSTFADAYSSLFPRMKIIFWFEVHWELFPTIQFTKIMTRRRTRIKPLSELMAHMCVSRPQRLKSLCDCPWTILCEICYDLDKHYFVILLCCMPLQRRCVLLASGSIPSSVFTQYQHQHQHNFRGIKPSIY